MHRLFLLFLACVLACEPSTMPADTGPVDQDGDGWLAAEDCDDADASVHPGATEVPYDGINEDCGDVLDEYDADGDGFDVDVDCDDTDVAVNPGVTDDTCDGVDDDCDGKVDDDGPSIAYADFDGDGHGDPSPVHETSYCSELPSGYVAVGDDCDDGDPSIHPGADDSCGDAKDENCDGSDGVVGEGATWYLDADADRYGVATETQLGCEQPPGYAYNADDCDDTDPTRHPGVAETCDDADDDCDGAVDEDGVCDTGG